MKLYSVVPVKEYWKDSENLKKLVVKDSFNHFIFFDT